MNIPTHIQDMLQNGLRLHQAGRLNEAESLYRQILQAKPSHPDANHLLGVLALQAGSNQAAIELITKALRKKPKEAEYHRNLGVALGGLGRLDDAIRSFRKALRLNPRLAEVHYNIGSALQQQGQLEGAVESYGKALAINPEYAQCHNNTGTALMALGRPEEAIACYQKALEITPNYAEAHYNAGFALGQLGQNDDAIFHYRQAVTIRPDYKKAHNNLGNVYKERGNTNKNRGLLEKALESFRRAIAIDPDYAQAYGNLGSALSDLGRMDDAIEALQKAVELDPNYTEAHHNLGLSFQALSLMDEARASFREAIRTSPDFAEAHTELALSIKHKDHDDEMRAMEKLIASPGSTDKQKMHLGFGLGKAFEDLGQYDTAFEFFRLANSLKRETISCDIQRDETYYQKIADVFSSSFFEKPVVTGDDDNTPIFILGMPRSGTSLVEQILACHPQVYGAGELNYIANMCTGLGQEGGKSFPEIVVDLRPGDFKKFGREYVERLREHETTANYITDKMPHNFVNIGMIRATLPNAKIIHCNRNPMDTCLSLYKNIFSGAHNYAYELNELGQYYKLYLKLMDHWRQVLPGQIIEIQYEELVDKPEPGIRQLLADCGLPFDEACLRFHESDRAVKTVSVNQVRKPMYKSSVNSWKRYEDGLAPLRDILADV